MNEGKIMVVTFVILETNGQVRIKAHTPDIHCIHTDAERCAYERLVGAAQVFMQEREPVLALVLEGAQA